MWMSRAVVRQSFPALLKPFLEGGETGEELVLGPGGLERWDYQAVVGRRL